MTENNLYVLRIAAAIASLIVGSTIIAAIFYYFPVWDILQTFAVVVAVPLVLLACFGIVSFASVAGLLDSVRLIQNKTKEFINDAAQGKSTPRPQAVHE